MWRYSLDVFYHKNDKETHKKEICLTWGLCHTRFSGDEVWYITRIITAWNSSPHITSVQMLQFKNFLVHEFCCILQIWVQNKFFSQLKVQINTDLVKHHRQAISNCYFALSIKNIKQYEDFRVIKLTRSKCGFLTSKFRVTVFY